MPHTITTRNRALHLIDAECERHGLPSYTDVAYALQQLQKFAVIARNCGLGGQFNECQDALNATNRILKQLKGNQ